MMELLITIDLSGCTYGVFAVKQVSSSSGSTVLPTYINNPRPSITTESSFTGKGFAGLLKESPTFLI
jgi:hypothetical protein